MQVDGRLGDLSAPGGVNKHQTHEAFSLYVGVVGATYLFLDCSPCSFLSGEL